MLKTDISNISIVAWWGAILSTVVFVWDIYKWRTAGPQLRFSVQTGMRSYNIPEYEGKTLILADVSNFGDRPTTIMKLVLLYYGNFWSYIRGRPDKSFAMVTPNSVQRIPHELKQGTIWQGRIIQTKAETDMAQKGYLVCALYHSHNNKPLKRRILIGNNSNGER